jgi:hypothetical protein
MAVLTAQGISSLAIELLTRSLVLPSTVSRIPGGEFAGANGDTITVRVPQPGSARTQATSGATITYDDVTEIPVDVSLSHLYHGKLVSDEEMSLQLEDFGRQITRIQVDAVATGAEDELTTVMNALAADSSFALSGSDTDTEDAIIAASETLDSNNAPAGDRYLAVSPQIKSRILKILDAADKAGDASALRRAVIGQLYGFTVVASNALTAGTALAYHRSGFAFANRVPVAPRGANDSATATAGGVGLRQIFQYVPDKLSDASVVSTFAGAAAVYEDGTGTNGSTIKRFYKLDTATA